MHSSAQNDCGGAGSSDRANYAHDRDDRVDVTAAGSSDPGRRTVTLDVGGRVFRTTADTLCAGSQYFRSLFERFPPAPPPPTDAAGNSSGGVDGAPLFIDRDPQAFEHVLALLRDPEYVVPVAYRRELLFYGVPTADGDDDGEAQELCASTSLSVKARGYGGKNSVRWEVCLPDDADAGARHVVADIVLARGEDCWKRWHEETYSEDDTDTGDFEQHPDDLEGRGRPHADGWRIDTVAACIAQHQRVRHLMHHTLDARSAHGMHAVRFRRAFRHPHEVRVERGAAVLATWHRDCLWMIEQCAGGPGATRCDTAVVLAGVVPPLPLPPAAAGAGALSVSMDKSSDTQKTLHCSVLATSSPAGRPFYGHADAAVAVPTCLRVCLPFADTAVRIDLPPGQAVTHVFLHAADPQGTPKHVVRTALVESDGRVVARRHAKQMLRWTAYADPYYAMAFDDRPPSPHPPGRFLRLGAQSTLRIERVSCGEVWAHVVYVRRMSMDGVSLPETW